MSIWNGNADDFHRLANDLSDVPAKAIRPLRGVMGDAGQALAKEWRANATATSGEHGKHYPASIDHEILLSARTIGTEAGPNAAKPQGSMGRGFEFGSVNQPPHLDGLRAVEAVAPRAEQMIGSAIGFLFP